MAVLNPPGWLENAGPTHTAAQMRNYLGLALAGTYEIEGLASLKPRGGVNLNIGVQCLVTQTGTPSMAVLVASGAVAIPGTEATGQGTYFAVNDAEVTLSVTTAHATLPRIDIVQFRVRDSFYSGAINDALLDVKAGTAAASPVAPTADPNALVLAEIAVGAGVTSITNANITDKRHFSAGSGGVIYTSLESVPPASTSIGEGQLWWAGNTDKIKVFDGTSHYTVWDKNVQGAGIGSFGLVRKTSDQSRTNTTTPAADSQLFLPLQANATYVVDGLIIYNSTDIGNDLKIRWDIPTSAQAFTGGAGPGPDVTDTIGLGEFFADKNTTGGIGVSYIIGVSANLSFNPGYILKALVVTAGTAGNFTLSWAVSQLSATATTVFAGSWLRTTKVA